LQPKLHSLLEAVFNTLSGFVLSFFVGLYLYPLFGFPVSPGQNLVITSVFTVLSIARSYLWRRLFNHYHHRRMK
jgi:hypothetical protein